MAETERAQLTPGAERLVRTVQEMLRDGRSAAPGTFHWLLALLERHGAMAEMIARDLDARTLLSYLQEQIRQDVVGEALPPETVVSRALGRAQARGRTQATERDVAAVILQAAGYDLSEPPLSDGMGREQHRPDPGKSEPDNWTAFTGRTARPTPALDEFGRDLTRAADEGKLGPVVGREREIELMIETLCRRTKRNPLLVGPAGVGKTAIVEGFARRVVQGQVPAPLRGVRVVELQPSVLIAGAGVVGELSRRMKMLLAEAIQGQVILFIDEVHSIVGAGGPAGSGDIASLLKPALARGDLACIAATTDDEFRRFIEPDAALERRFQPIRVQELTAAETRVVLAALREDLTRVQHVAVPDEVLDWLIDFAGEFLRNRTFPDKAVDLVEQCAAYALTRGQTTVSLADARAVAQRMVSMSLTVRESLEALRGQLAERALLLAGDETVLLNRLAVSLRGLDLRSARPNAVLLLIDEARVTAAALARLISETLFGSAERVISIDFGRFTQPQDVTMLIGAPPGYVGYQDNLPLYRLAQIPWCVLHGDNLQACHPQVRDIFTQALASGVLTDATGKKIYFSDAIVVLTATVGVDIPRPIGFQRAPGGNGSGARQTAEKVLGTELVRQVDLVIATAPQAEVERRRWLERTVLVDLPARYRKQGVDLRCDESVITWLLSRETGDSGPDEWARLVDESLSPLLIPYLPADGATCLLTVRYRDGAVQVEMSR